MEKFKMQHEDVTKGTVTQEFSTFEEATRAAVKLTEKKPSEDLHIEINGQLFDYHEGKNYIDAIDDQRDDVRRDLHEDDVHLFIG